MTHSHPDTVQSCNQFLQLQHWNIDTIDVSIHRTLRELEQTDRVYHSSKWRALKTVQMTRETVWLWRKFTWKICIVCSHPLKFKLHKLAKKHYKVWQKCRFEFVWIGSIENVILSRIFVSQTKYGARHCIFNLFLLIL